MNILFHICFLQWMSKLNFAHYMYIIIYFQSSSFRLVLNSVLSDVSVSSIEKYFEFPNIGITSPVFLNLNLDLLTVISHPNYKIHFFKLSSYIHHSRAWYRIFSLCLRHLWWRNMLGRERRGAELCFVLALLSPLSRRRLG